MALYGPDDKTTTKIAAGVILHDGAEAIIERWVATDVTTNPKVQKEMQAFFKKHGVKSVAMSSAWAARMKKARTFRTARTVRSVRSGRGSRGVARTCFDCGATCTEPTPYPASRPPLKADLNACRYIPGSTESPRAWRMPMKPMELFRSAIKEIGDASAVELSAHLEKKHGVKIEPAFIPVFKATLEQLERTNQLRQEAKPIAPEQPAPAT